MKIGTQSKEIDKVFGPHQALLILKNAGFEAVDFSLENEERLKKDDSELLVFFEDIKKYADEIGIEIGQTHAPFYNRENQMNRFDEIVKLQINAIKATAFLGCKYIVIHPLQSEGRIYDLELEETKKLNMKYYGALIPALLEYDVYCAIENMFARDPEKGILCPTTCTTSEEMVDFIDSLGERFVACLDIGHINLIHQKEYPHVSFEHMINTLDYRLKVLHVHDNNGKDDQHLPPFAGNIDWSAVVKALKKIGYAGNLSIEADTFITYIKPEQFEKAENVIYAYAKRLYDMF